MSLPGLLLGIIPGFVWLSFYLKEDPHPEPKRLIAFTFLLGGISTLFALFIQILLKQSGVLENINASPVYAFLPLIVFAVIEEVCKFGAAYFSIHKSRDFDEPIDAMIYMITAALGFATIENIAVLQGYFSDSTLFAGALGITSSRFLGATLLHALSSAFFGYYWALSKRDNKVIFIFMGLLIATILHAGFNYLILSYESLVYPTILLITGGFFALEDFEDLKKPA